MWTSLFPLNHPVLKKLISTLFLVLFLLCYLSWLMLLVIFTELLLQILTGHQDNAEFALAMCPTQPYVLSGGWETCFFFFFIHC